MAKKLKGPVKKVWESKIKQSPSKNLHISYSSISTYNKCPRLWEKQYLRNGLNEGFFMQRVNSNSLHEEALNHLVGGVNSPVRAFKSVHGNLIYFESASGAIVTDVDGNSIEV